MGRESQLLHIGSVRPSSTLSPTHIKQIVDNSTVLTAATVSDALETLESQPVDCVICEPSGADSGVEIVRAVRECAPRLPVFLVVRDATTSTIEAAISAGVTDCVVPPLDETDRRLLANRIRNAVDTTPVQSTATSRPTADSEFAASKAGYQSLAEDVLGASCIGTFMLDAAFSVVWINERIERYFDVDSEIIGQDKRTLIETRIKHIFEEPDRFANRVIATYDDNTYVEQFECHVTPDDDRKDRWLEHWSYPISSGPYRGGRIEHYVDITERKQREQELNAERKLLDRVFETSPIGIVLLDSDGEIIRTNSHGEIVLGSSHTVLADRSYDDPAWEVHDEDGETIPSEKLPFAIAKETGEPVFDYEHGITLADGTDRWLSINASPLLAADGSVDRVICTIADITAARESAQALSSHNEQLEEFASIVSHDLRNPLNVLTGSLELASETGEPVHFERAARAATRMNQLIEDLLLLARSGREIDETELVDLPVLLGECWQQFSVDEAKLAVETDLQVVADESRLAQLFENLFRNAIEHAGPAVTITVGELADGVFVSDDGPGIPTEHREQIFEQGFTTTPTGTGLGLYIVTQIATAHGWDLRLAETAVGTRIELTGLETAA